MAEANVEKALLDAEAQKEEQVISPIDRHRPQAMNARICRGFKTLNPKPQTLEPSIQSETMRLALIKEEDPKP